MNLEELKENLKIIGLGDHIEPLSKISKETIRLHPRPAKDEDFTIGQSKIGGKPDLPSTINWPIEKEINGDDKGWALSNLFRSPGEPPKSLSFLAQINLTEISEFAPKLDLPSKGMLYFFYCQHQGAWGFDPSDADKFSVIYYDGELSELTRTEFPSDIDDNSKFGSSKIEFRAEVSMPSYPHAVYEELDENKIDKMFELIDGQEMSKLFGYPDVIQNPMELQCELVTNGLYCGDGTGYSDPRAKLLAKNTKDWFLLFQLDSHEENGMMWGDCGRLFFWIKQEDLKRQDFEHAWCVLQCY